MQPKSRLKINLSGNKSYYLWNGTEAYYKKLRSAYKDIQNDVESNYLFFGFFTLCASTLEYSLNYILADYCVKEFSPETYKSYLKEYNNLSFKNKLLMIPHIISNGKFAMNEDHPTFKNLVEMITLRNKILHNKEFLREFDCPINGEIHEDGIFIPVEKAEQEFKIEVPPNYIDTLTKERCLKFGDSMGNFKKYVMNPALNDTLKANPMILKKY